MSKGKIKKITVYICIVSLVIVSIYFFVKKFGADKSASNDKNSQSAGQIASGDNDEVKQYVDAISFFESADGDNWNEMVEISPLFTEEAFVQSLYYLGKIDMNIYDQKQTGVQEISQNIKDAEYALNYLIKSLNGEESYDKYEGSLMLSESINHMNEIKQKVEEIKENHAEYFDK